jgi:hypothetical protein
MRQLDIPQRPWLKSDQGRRTEGGDKSTGAVAGNLDSRWDYERRVRTRMEAAKASGAVQMRTDFIRIRSLALIP